MTFSVIRKYNILHTPCNAHLLRALLYLKYALFCLFIIYPVFKLNYSCRKNNKLKSLRSG